MSEFSHAGTTVADFLKWERNAQVSFLQISISMAGVIASQTRPDIAKCLNTWYFVDSAVQKKRNDQMIENMANFTQYDPTAVVLGYVQEACGAFKDR